MRAAEVSRAHTVVELGPGTGGTTAAILHAMPPGSRLLSIEINTRFHELLGNIDDGRLTAHCGSAVDLVGILAAHGLDAPDAVVSGIPFSRIGEAEGSRVIQAIADGLSPGGRFVAYQVSDRVARLARPVLGEGRRSTEWLSIPPIRVFRWQKPLG